MLVVGALEGGAGRRCVVHDIYIRMVVCVCVCVCMYVYMCTCVCMLRIPTRIYIEGYGRGLVVCEGSRVAQGLSRRHESRVGREEEESDVAGGRGHEALGVSHLLMESSGLTLQ